MAGIFGKLPALGDFLSRDLPGSFTDPWHAWLVNGLSFARAELGERYLDAYLQSPVWRFALPAGACGGDPVAGLFLPSVDAADRLFPLTLAAITATRPDSAWLDALEDLGRAALSDDLDLPAWRSEVAALEPTGSQPIDCLRLWSEGSPLVAAVSHEHDRLPEGQGFVRLLVDTLPSGRAA